MIITRPLRIFMATNPRDLASVTWVVTQTHASGEKLEWNGAPGSKPPASVTFLFAPPIAWMNYRMTAWIAGAALLPALAALLLSARRATTLVAA